MTSGVGPNTAYAMLYMDSGLNHSAAYFAHSAMSLEDAQKAKIAAILHRCELRPGLRLLDIGCGWGSTAIAAASEYGANVIGITLDPEHYHYSVARKLRLGGKGTVSFRLQDWENCTDRVDRITCINSFENFSRKEGFFTHCRRLLPEEIG